MRRSAPAGEPRLLAELRSRLTDVAARSIGVSEGWLMPANVYEARSGFGEDTWVMADETVVAWRTSGASIRCHSGPAKDRECPPDTPLITVTPPGTPYYWSAASAVTFGHLTIPDGLVRRVAEELALPAPGAVAWRDDLVFFEDEALFAALVAYTQRSDAPPPPSRLEMEARAILIVDYLLRTYHGGGAATRGGLAPYQMRRVQEHVEAHLSDDLSVGELAALAGLSASHFCRAFKRSAGTPPHVWLCARRMERAKALMLAQPQMGLTEIALCVGYESQAAFGTAFRRQTGASPSRWRRERRG